MSERWLIRPNLINMQSLSVALLINMGYLYFLIFSKISAADLLYVGKGLETEIHLLFEAMYNVHCCMLIFPGCHPYDQQVTLC